MATDNTKKRGLGWFKTSSNEQIQENSIEQEFTGIMQEEQFLLVEESEQNTKQNNKNLFAKDSQDKVVLDLIVSIENMIKDRQLILYKNKGLEEQIFNANESIGRLKQEQMKKDQLIQEKHKEIRALESGLTNKQMSYDQLLEDYKEFQNTSNMEYEKISNQLEIEINKYNKLNEDSINYQYQSTAKINDLEEKIRTLQIENQKYGQQYNKIVDEKNELMQTINDFTQRMSFSFSPKSTSSNSSDSK